MTQILCHLLWRYTLSEQSRQIRFFCVRGMEDVHGVDSAKHRADLRVRRGPTTLARRVWSVGGEWGRPEQYWGLSKSKISKSMEQEYWGKAGVLRQNQQAQVSWARVKSARVLRKSRSIEAKSANASVLSKSNISKSIEQEQVIKGKATEGNRVGA